MKGKRERRERCDKDERNEEKGRGQQERGERRFEVKGLGNGKERKLRGKMRASKEKIETCDTNNWRRNGERLPAKVTAMKEMLGPRNGRQIMAQDGEEGEKCQ